MHLSFLSMNSLLVGAAGGVAVFVLLMLRRLVLNRRLLRSMRNFETYIVDRELSGEAIADQLAAFDEQAVACGATPLLDYTQTMLCGTVVHLSLTADRKALVLGVIVLAGQEFVRRTGDTPPTELDDPVRGVHGPVRQAWTEVSTPLSIEGKSETLITSATPITALATGLTEGHPVGTPLERLLTCHNERLAEMLAGGTAEPKPLPKNTEEAWDLVLEWDREMKLQMTG
jgi:hypothetical protein